jgi:hypothetical protein
MVEKIELEDFSGGVTDYYLSAPPNKMKECDNLLINQYQNQGKVFTRPGSELYDKNWPQPYASRINTCFKYKGILFVQIGARLFYYSPNAIGNKWVQLKNPNNADPFFAANDIYYSYSFWNSHILMTGSSASFSGPVGFVQKIVIENGVPSIFNAGLPPFFYTVAPTTGSNVYLYKLVFSQKYKAGGAEFEDIGTPSASITYKTTSPIGGGSTVTLTSIPVISANDGFRTNELKKDIYRTVNNGTTFFYVGTINNNVTEFTDNNLDSVISANKQLYTNGGVSPNDLPQFSRCLHIKNDIAYYGNVLDRTGNEILNFRLYQSIVGDIDSVPEDFYIDLDDEIISISSTKNNVIVLCRRSVYRIDGIFDDLGRGGMVAERISDTAGCISVQGTVQALDGVFWLGDDGAYFTDGFKVMKLNEDHVKRYKTYVNPSEVSLPTGGSASRVQKIQGKYDKRNNRIWWIMQSSKNADDTDFCYILDLNWGIRPNATFTTASGDSLYPSAIEFDDDDMIRCHKNGYVLIHKDTLFTDPKVNPSAAVANWREETIVYSLETGSYNFGTSAVRKYVTQANVTCESTTNLSLRIVSNNDNDRIVADLLPIRSRGNILWGEPDVYWGDYTLDWNKQGLIHEKRLMPAKSLRCNYKSLKFTNAHVAIVSSDIIGNASVNATLKQATLNGSNSKWLTRSIGYFISFEDDFTKEYEITGLSGDEKIITYSDPLGTSLNGSNKQWVIRGRPLGEVLNLLNLSLIYDIAGPSQGAYKVSNSGEAGTNQ